MMTRFARQGGTGGGPVAPGQVTAAYVRALGGAAAAAAAAVAGRVALGQLGRFLAGVAGVGLAPTLEREGLADLVGQDASTVLAALLDRLVAPQGTLEAEIAHDAMVDVLEEMAGEAETFADLDSTLIHLDAVRILDLLERFLVEYTYRRMLLALEERIQLGAETPADIVNVEQGLHGFIGEAVHFELGDVDLLRLDWDGPEGQHLIERAMTDAYLYLE
jgi:hypothetical protein